MQQKQMPADVLMGFNNPQYDLAAKRILSERAVAAYLLKGTNRLRAGVLSIIIE